MSRLTSISAILRLQNVVRAILLSDSNAHRTVILWLEKAIVIDSALQPVHSCDVSRFPIDFQGCRADNMGERHLIHDDREVALSWVKLRCRNASHTRLRCWPTRTCNCHLLSPPCRVPCHKFISKLRNNQYRRHLFHEQT